MKAPLTTILQRGWPADLVFWFLYASITQFIFAPAPLHPNNIAIQLAFTVGEAAAVYGHLHYGLHPLLRKRCGGGRYLLVLLAALTVGVASAWAALTAVSALLVPDMLDTLSPGEFFASWLIRVGWSIVTLVALTAGLFLFTYRRRQVLREHELEAAKLASELAFLRGQLNPHFLFNALNNIYVLISHDTERAKEGLLGFSDLLRYQLYTAESGLVPLAEEVDHLLKFAHLARLRTEEDFRFCFDRPDDLDGRSIPPMLLLPLLENAFKYSPAQAGNVIVALTLEGGHTSFRIENIVQEDAPADRAPRAGGIGLTNLRRRLELLYPGQYRLETRQGAGLFTVTLSVPTQ